MGADSQAFWPATESLLRAVFLTTSSSLWFSANHLPCLARHFTPEKWHPKRSPKPLAACRENRCRDLETLVNAHSNNEEYPALFNKMLRGAVLYDSANVVAYCVEQNACYGWVKLLYVFLLLLGLPYPFRLDCISSQRWSEILSSLHFSSSSGISHIPCYSSFSPSLLYPR